MRHLYLLDKHISIVNAVDTYFWGVLGNMGVMPFLLMYF